ncbi:MAG: hypothetical protein ABI823_02475 [Bryobacteraceae bacterium]
MRFLFFLFAITAFGQDLVPNPTFPLLPKSSHMLTNESVVHLAKAGFDEQFIVELIQSSRTRLDASASALISLKQQGLSEELIRFIALRERLADQVAAQPAPRPSSSGPASTTHIEKHWWGYRWFVVSRPLVPTTSSTFTVGASTASQADMLTSPR